MGIFKWMRGSRRAARDRPASRSVRAQAGTQRVSRRAGPLASIFSGSAAKETMRASEIYYAGVSRIANTVGMLPCRLYRGQELVRDTPLAQLVSLRPNRRQSWIDFMKSSEIWRNTEGRSYWLKLCDPVTMEVRELVVLDPTRVTAKRDPQTGEIWYDIVRPFEATVDRVHSFFVLAFTHMSTDGVEGVRVSDVLAGTIDYDKNIKRYSEQQLAGVTRGVTLSFPTDMDEERRIAAVDEFVRVYQHSNGTVMALDAGVTATQFALSPVDAQVQGVEKITRNRIATVLNMPPHLLGDYSDAGPATVEQMTLEFLTMTIVSIVTMYEQEMDWRLLTPQQRREGWHFRFETEAMLRCDMTTKANYYFQAVRTGYLLINDVRAKEYLPPLPGGDVPMISKDLAPLAMVIKGGTIGENGGTA